jgi:hypothetical protein
MAVSSLAVFPADPREHEIRLLVDLVRLSRVTLLYGDAESEQSELLLSNVIPLLQAAPRAPKTEVALYFDTWGHSPLAALHRRIEESVEDVRGRRDVAPAPVVGTLAAHLAALQRELDVTFFIVFDRFDVLLRRSEDDAERKAFEDQFIEAVNDPALRANFLLSLDEAAAPLIDRLRERIPGLGDARVRMPAADPTTRSPKPVRVPRSDARSTGALIGSGPASTRAEMREPPSVTPEIPSEVSAPALDVSQNAPNPAPPMPVFLGSVADAPSAAPPESLAERVARMRAEYAEKTPASEAGATHPTSVEIAAAVSHAADAPEAPARPTEPHVHAPERFESAEAKLGSPEPLVLRAERRIDKPESSAPETTPSTIDHRAPGTEKAAYAATPHVPPAVTLSRRDARLPRGAWIAVAVVVIALSYLMVLEFWPAGERARVTMQPAAPQQPTAEQSAQAAEAVAAQGNIPALPGDETPLRSEDDYYSAQGSYPDTSNAARAGERLTPTPTPAPPAAPAARPSARVTPAKKAAAPVTAPTAASGPLLYIHVRSENQRARVEHLIGPLARRGIRVTGIKVVRSGPAVTDLRYFRSGEREEALKVALALRDVGVSTQRLKRISGLEGRATRRQYELWLPATAADYR